MVCGVLWCVCACMWNPKDNHGCHSSGAIHIVYYEKEASLSLEFFHWAGFSGQWSMSLALELQAHATMPSHSTWVQGNMVVLEVLYQPSYLPSPQPCFMFQSCSLQHSHEVNLMDRRITILWRDSGDVIRNMFCLVRNMHGWSSWSRWNEGLSMTRELP